jgi:hypothetical protein
MEDKQKALYYFQQLRQMFRDWNAAAWRSPEFADIERRIRGHLGTSGSNEGNAHA